MASTLGLPKRNKLTLTILLAISLPWLTILLWFNYAAVVLVEQKKSLALRRRKHTVKTVLITGSANAYGLNLARAFHNAGYRVIGADVQNKSILNIAKRSRAISRHVDIPQVSAVQDSSYVARCIFIIAKQNMADIWIDCSEDLSPPTVALAQREIEQGTSCACIAPNKDVGRHFEDHQGFFGFLHSHGLPAPEVHKVKSRAQIHNILGTSRGKKQYLLTSPTKDKRVDPRALLPRRTLSQTYHDVSLVKINSDSQVVLEESVDTTMKFQCFLIILQGTIRSFWVRKIYADESEGLDEQTALWHAMKSYSESLVHELGQDCSCHLLLAFGLTEKVTHSGVVQQILPIEGQLRIEPTFVLSINQEKFADLVNTYQVRTYQNGSLVLSQQKILAKARFEFSGQGTKSRYLLLEDIANLVIKPCRGLLMLQDGPRVLFDGVHTLCAHLLFSEEAYYDFWDPLPAFWQYTVVLGYRAVVG